jgi:hypothetical protein
MPGRDDLVGRTVLDAGGEKLGSVEQIYGDVANGPTTWALLSTGLFGLGHKSMVPIDGAHERDDGLSIPYTKAQVEQAPEVEDPPTTIDAARLTSYYGVGPAAGEGAVHAVAPQPNGQDGGPSSEHGDPEARWHREAVASTGARPAQESPDHITPADLADFGGQLAAYGQQLAAYGQKLAYFAQQLADAGRATDGTSHQGGGRRPAR